MNGTSPARPAPAAALSGATLPSLLGFLCVLLFALPAFAQGERILSFESHIAVEAEGHMVVTETIRVRAAGERIRRGIYRDFPTDYRDRGGRRYRVGFEVLEAARDGAAEDWHTERLANGVRVYLGHENRRLPPGEHTYRLVYRTDRQLGFFETHDELYWNVTGNGWEFPIDQAVARVVLPASVPEILLLEAYTGPEGARGREYTGTVTSHVGVTFRTTRPLAPREGLTIVVGWPKGHVREPTGKEQALRLLRDNLELPVAAAGLAAILFFYVFVWRAVGKDPRKGVVVPRYTPPADLSPAAVRFVSRMGWDDTVFAAGLLNLAVKGHLAIEEGGDGFRLLRGTGGKEPPSADEAILLTHLFAGKAKAVEIDRKQRPVIVSARAALQSSLRAAFETTHFVLNRGAFLTGAAISLAAVGASFLAALPGPEVIFLGVWLSVWSVGVYLLLRRTAALWRALFAGRQRLGGTIGALLAALFMTLFSLPFLAGEVYALWMLADHSTVFAVFPVLAAAVNLLFFHLLKAPTLLGRRLLDQIEGFRTFLAATEADRLERLTPEGRTPALFEKYLPYALALGVENRWAEKFADVLAAAGQAAGKEGYRPSWYAGDAWDASAPGNFADSLGASLSGAIASASTSPGSSSGGGGGSSGGGGGGGGGGGW